MSTIHYGIKEIHITHDLSDRDNLRIGKDLEPRDYMSASIHGVRKEEIASF
jgi:hypothetical protein